MSRWPVAALGVLACASLAVNAALWGERRALLDETHTLRASVAILSAARAADTPALAARDKLDKEARHAAAQKNKGLDLIEAGGADLGDNALLDALRRLLSDNADCGPDPAGKPAGTAPDPGYAGGAYAKP